MDRRVISLCLSLSLMLLFAGCAGKTVCLLVRGCQPHREGKPRPSRSSLTRSRWYRLSAHLTGHPAAHQSILRSREHGFREQCIGRRVLRLRPVFKSAEMP